MEILVLGDSGLLGNTVKSYLEQSGLIVNTIPKKLRWNTPEFKNYIKNNNFDFIVNCIGAIHQRTREFSINYELPIWLDLNSKSKIIHPGTDCEMDVDDYGKSKKVARDYIVDHSSNTKIIKTSIIGIENVSNYSLMSWFLSTPENESVNGFTNQMWNGNTTLTWAKFCKNLIEEWEKYGKETILHSKCISKYEVLLSINKIFDRKINIIPLESKNEVNKCLFGGVETAHIEFQLEEFKNFIMNINGHKN